MGTLEELIVEAKKSGLTDQEIGDKYHVSFTFIQKAVTRLIGVNVSTLEREKKIKTLEPKKFKLESGTVWSFKSRGKWATHTGDYRGNWSPFIPRNVILRYSRENETVLDCFCGSGATAVECKLLNRNFIGLDINASAIELAKKNVNFDMPRTLFRDHEPSIKLAIGNARDLSAIRDDSIDLICAHPPYADIIQYTANKEQDISFLEMDDFLQEMSKVARENHRVLKEGRHCAILIGDMRKNKHIVPLGFKLIDVYLQNGFILKELIIKRQHNCRTTGFWYKNSIKYNFLLLAHEYLAIFKKSEKSDSVPISNVQKLRFEIPKTTSNYKLETMTVWISNPVEWYSHTIANLVSRYNGKNFTIVQSPRNLKKSAEKHDLVIWDARFKPALSYPDAENITASLESGGYLVVLCEDSRMKDGSIFPAAINAEKELAKMGHLKIREIIMISIENRSETDNSNQNLSIDHKYLLVFQKLSE